MEYTIDDRLWAEPMEQVSVAGTDYPGAAANSFTPDRNECLGEIRAWQGKKKPVPGDRVSSGGLRFALRPVPARGHFFARNAGWVRVHDRAGCTSGYVKVLRLRPTALVGAALALAALALAAYALGSDVPVQEAPSFLADQVGISHNNADVKASISYAAYESTPDQTWKAGSTSQSMRLSLPATVTSTDEEGNKTKQDNPVVAAPHIYVDFDEDGSFSDDELVFNPIARDAQGNVTDWGKFLEPGKEIDEIELVRPLDAGSYSARTTWTPLSQADGSQANPMSFDWNLTVE